MAQEYIGSQSILSQTNPWLTGIALYLCTVTIGLLGRKIFEGLAYNVSYSSKYGDAALVMCIVIAARILQREPSLPDWLVSRNFHVICAVISVVIGLAVGGLAIVQTTWAQSQIIDMCHNFLVVPFFLYTLSTMLPVTYWQGTTYEKIVTLACLVTWLALVWYDAHNGRLDQRSWLRAHGQL